MARRTWLAAHERRLARAMARTVETDYGRVIAEAQAQADGPDAARRRAVARLRRELRRIGSRDYFPGPIAKRARAVVEALGELVEAAS